MKALVAGWFSYANGHATAGDLLARDLLCQWLEERNVPCRMAVAPPFTDGEPLDAFDPDEFTHVFFVCGPFGRGELEADFLRRFARCRLIGLNLSLDLSPADWNPFDLLIERDSTRNASPDMIFASRQPLPPIIGVCLVEDHPEADVATAHAAILSLLRRHPGARVDIDTRLDLNETRLRTKGEIEALIARMDLVVTSRLHGLALALKNGVPVVAIDAVPGHGKIMRQCRQIGWSNVLGLNDLTDERLDAALGYALSEEGRQAAAACAAQASSDVEALRAKLMRQLLPDGEIEQRFNERLAAMDMYLAALPAAPVEDEEVIEAPKPGLRRRWRRLLNC